MYYANINLPAPDAIFTNVRNTGKCTVDVRLSSLEIQLNYYLKKK